MKTKINQARMLISKYVALESKTLSEGEQSGTFKLFRPIFNQGIVKKLSNMKFNINIFLLWFMDSDEKGSNTLSLSTKKCNLHVAAEN